MKQIHRSGYWIQMLIIGSFLLSISACETADPVVLEDKLVDTGLTEAKIQEAADRAEQAEYRLDEMRKELIGVQQMLEQREADLQFTTQRLIRTQRLVTVLVLILIGLSYSLWRVRFSKGARDYPDWRAMLTNWGLLKSTSQPVAAAPQKDPEPKKSEPRKPEPKKPVSKKPAAKKPGTKKPTAPKK